MANSPQKRQSSGSFGSRGNYNRLVENFGPVEAAPVVVPTDYHQNPDGSWQRWNGMAWVASVDGPPVARPAVSDVRPFVAAEVLNKVLILAGLALAFGVVSALLKVPDGVAFVAIFAALGIALWTIFQPHRAPILAPIYAAVEGVALGVISQLFTSQAGRIVPLAIIGTSVVFFGVLGAYRTGLVKVGPTFVRATIIASFGLLAVMVAVLLGLPLPGFSQGSTYFIVFGVLYLVVAVMDLFVDFNYVYKAEKAGVSAEGEWFAAFSIMLAVVMIYLSLLRILGGGRR